MQANTRIKNHIKRKGAQVKQLAKNGDMKPYAMCALKYLSSILNNLQLLEENIKGKIKVELNSSEVELCSQQIW